MKHLLIITVFFGSFSIITHAAKPKSVVQIEDVITANDEIFTHYVVKCNNGVEVDVSAWNNKKLWCLGKGKKDVCKKKQIKIAKKACKGA